MLNSSDGEVSFRQLLIAFRALEIPCDHPVLVHSSLAAFGAVAGGAETVVRALLGLYPTLLAPAFTFKTEIIPEVGPADNASDYGRSWKQNRLAEFFDPDMPADRLMGIIPETLRKWPGARRSLHPILSFVGVNADATLAAQTLEAPLDPIRVLYDQAGWVLLVGVDHTVNTAIHYGELRAGRKQFVRWALAREGAITCPGFPGCSDGFQAISAQLEAATRRSQAGNAALQAVPVRAVVDTAADLIRRDPLALLCSRPTCPRCDAVRQSVT